MNDGAITVRDAALYLSVSGETVNRLGQRRELSGSKAARASRFRRGDIDAWIEEQKQAAVRPLVDS